MAPFTISPHHPLSYQCHLPQTAPYKQSKMSLELSSNTSVSPKDLPLIPYRRMSIFSTLLIIRLHLWQVIQRVLNCCMSVTERFSSKMFLFICVGKNTAMMGELKKNGVVEVQERPGGEFMSELDEKMMELDDEGMTTSAERQEWSMEGSDEEEEDEGQLSEWESDEETDDDEEEDKDDENNGEQPPQEETECDDDVDSEWSDEDDDSEASAESLELWESFLKSSDPYNPLSFSSCIGSQTNNTSTSKNQLSSKNKQTKPTPATNEEEHDPKPSTKSGKKVCFSDEVTVRPLVAWCFASRAARDGSCWMRMARDRARFRRRVESVEKIITPCFTPEHRADTRKRLERETLS